MSNQRIIACISTYGSSKTLEQTLSSIAVFVDHVVVIYGHYLGFPPLLGDDAQGESASKTAEVIKASGIPYTYTIANNLLQKDKRSMLLSLKAEHWYGDYLFQYREGDWLLIIDDDEVLIDDDEVLKYDGRKKSLLTKLGAVPANYGTVIVKNIWQSIDILQNRFVKWAPEIRYHPNHWTISKGEEVYVQNSTPPFYAILGSEITNNPVARSKIWLHHRALYRLLRFVFNQKDWKDGYFEVGEHKPEFYDAETVQKVIDKVADKVAKEQNPFDIAFLETLAWIALNCERDTIWSDAARGRVAAILFAYGLVPDPYL